MAFKRSAVRFRLAPPPSSFPLGKWISLAAAAFLALCPAMPAPAAAPDPRLAGINHILVVYLENHSFDNLYGTFPGADGFATATGFKPQSDRDGTVYPTLPQPMLNRPGKSSPDARFPASLANAPFAINSFMSPDEKTGDLKHEFFAEQLQIHDGAMDRYAAWSDAKGLVMGYYEGEGTRGWALAREFALGDRMFHSAFGGSFLSHTWLVCSCALEWPNAPADIIAEADGNGVPRKDGQVLPDGHVVNTSRSIYLHKPSETDPSRLVPGQTLPHIGDRLDAKGVSWAWFSGGYDDAMAGKPDPLFQFHHQPLAYFKDLAPGTPGQKAHLKDAKDLWPLIDVGQLPQVAFYKPFATLNQHPGYASMMAADRHLGDLIDRLRASPSWKDTLIIVTYDENGGQWDHVAPPRRDKWGPGTRVPLLVIGPMVKPGFVDHTAYDHGSILKLISLRFGTQPVNAIDGAATPMTGMLR